MQYYNNEISQKYPELIKYFSDGIYSDNKNISHCLLFWGADIQSQCELALEVARLLNCTKDGNPNCDCLNCKWIREQSHPAVKIYTRFDYKEDSAASTEDSDSKGKKNININQAKAIINELSISSDYHRVYIFCDRDENGNLLPLNRLNFPEVTSNALLKTFEEPPKNTTFIFLTTNKTDIIETIVSRAQSFFVPSTVLENTDFNLVQNTIQNYWTFNKNQVLNFENNIMNLISNNDAKEIFTQIQNYMLATIKSNPNNKHLFYKLMNDMNSVEDAKKQISLTPAMNIQTVVENLCFKLILN